MLNHRRRPLSEVFDDAPLIANEDRLPPRAIRAAPYPLPSSKPLRQQQQHRASLDVRRVLAEKGIQMNRAEPPVIAPAHDILHAGQPVPRHGSKMVCGLHPCFQLLLLLMIQTTPRQAADSAAGHAYAPASDAVPSCSPHQNCRAPGPRGSYTRFRCSHLNTAGKPRRSAAIVGRTASGARRASVAGS